MITKLSIVLGILLFFPFSLLSQSATFCHYYGEGDQFNHKDICATLSFTTNAEAEETVDNILYQVGLKRNFIVMECPNIKNALAVNLPSDLGSIRYIIYDNKFLEEVQSNTDTKWSSISILAHEVGHHLNGHTLTFQGSNHKDELEADEFSGFVLAKLGATLEEAKSAINTYNSIYATSTHPSKKDRLDAIEKGYENGRSTLLEDKIAISTNDIEKLNISLERKSSSQRNKSYSIVSSDIKSIIKRLDKGFRDKTLNNRKRIDYSLAIRLIQIVSSVNLKKLDFSDRSRFIQDLHDSENLLNNYAILAYQEQDYSNAFNAFAGSLIIYSLLDELNSYSRLDEGSLLNDQLFFTAVSGYYDGRNSEALPYLEKLYESGSNEPFVYDALYNIIYQTDLNRAYVILKTGRRKIPNDSGLLFTEINHYLKIGELDKLISRLKDAIIKEPDNPSVYTTLGSVYDQLHQKAIIEGNTAKASDYFEDALFYYNSVLDRDRNNFVALYSIGALYYNRAASYVNILNDLATDLSPRGMREYDLVKIKMDDDFKKAKPYFERAYKIRPSDQNTQIALREIKSRLR